VNRAAPLVFALAIAALGGCHRNQDAEGPIERAGKQVDKAANKTGKALGKAADKTGEAFQKAGKKLQGDDPPAAAPKKSD
jgi:hypothetical protein